MDRFQLAKRTKKKQGTVPQKQEGTEQRLKVSKEQGGVGACGGWGTQCLPSMGKALEEKTQILKSLTAVYDAAASNT